MAEVRKHSRTANFDDPHFLANNPTQSSGTRRLTPEEIILVEQLLEQKHPIAEIADKVGVTRAAISKRKKKLERECVPDACQRRRPRNKS